MAPESQSALEAQIRQKGDDDGRSKTRRAVGDGALDAAEIDQPRESALSGVTSFRSVLLISKQTPIVVVAFRRW
jgi:hypothetical protein